MCGLFFAKRLRPSNRPARHEHTKMSDSNNDVEVEEIEEVEEEDSPPSSPPGPWTFIIAAVLFVAVLIIWLWNSMRQSKGLKYRAPIIPLPGAPVDPNGGDGKYVLRDNIAFKKGIQWEPVSSDEVKRAGFTKIDMVGLASPALASLSLDSKSLQAYADSISASMSAFNNGSMPTLTLSAAAGDDNPNKIPEATQQEIDDFIHSRLPINPQDLAGVKCGSKTDYLFFQSTRLPNSDQTIIKPSQGGGYCVQTCASARISTYPDTGLPTDLSKSFNNAKMADGSYLVNYELALWIDPRHNEAGYTWYCRAVPNPKSDGIGWSPTVDGSYQRRLISPVYYTTSRDPFTGTYGSGNDQNDDWRLCSNSTLPIPSPSELGGVTYTASTDRWHGQVFRGGGSGSIAKYGKPWGIGYNKTDYTLVDFQMIGRYCYWVGHDDYDIGDENSSKANATWHGNFSKIKLADACPQQQTGIDGLKYDMKLTPSRLSCYYCPRIYEWNEDTKSLEAYQTYLRGSEVDNYVCVRSCPAGMTDEQSGNLHWCIPIGIGMPIEFPIITIK